MNRAPIIENPVLLDKVLGQFQQELAARVAWLNNCFGKAQRLVKKELDRQDHYYPAVFTGGNEYESALPDSRFGNFSFFDIPDPYSFPVYNRFQANKFFTPFRLIVFFDEDTIFGPGVSNKEALKMDVLGVLGQITLKHGGLWVEKVYERHENIYKDYSLSEVDAQYLMRPYGAFCIEGRLELSEECIATMPPPVEVGTALYDNADNALYNSDGKRLYVQE